MKRRATFVPEEYYHVYNRGVDKREIFSSKSDYDRFLALLYLCNTDTAIRFPKDASSDYYTVYITQRENTLVDICAYCLMPNHFHILLREREEGGISAFMQRLTTAYTMYFNTRSERSGSLFQGPFKAEHASDDRYLKYLIAYIHLNPVKIVEPLWSESGISEREKAQDFLESYAYSSYQDFSGSHRPQNAILTKGALPEYFSTPTSFKDNLKEWIEYRAEKA